jgi:nitrite reductase/ring-hydroxylating ferredoxin subunit
MSEDVDSAAATGESDSRHFVAAADDIPVGERTIVDVDGLEVGVFHLQDGFYALSNYCVHQGGPVCEGMISGTLRTDDEVELTYDEDETVVSCPWHGWEFDVKSGTHLARDQYRLPSFDVEVSDGDVYVVV